MTDPVTFEAWVLRDPETGKILALSGCDLIDHQATAEKLARGLAFARIKRKPVRARVTVEVLEP